MKKSFLVLFFACLLSAALVAPAITALARVRNTGDVIADQGFGPAPGEPMARPSVPSDAYRSADLFGSGTIFYDRNADLFPRNVFPESMRGAQAVHVHPAPVPYGNLWGDTSGNGAAKN